MALVRIAGLLLRIDEAGDLGKALVDRWIAFSARAVDGRQVQVEVAAQGAGEPMGSVLKRAGSWLSVDRRRSRIVLGGEGRLADVDRLMMHACAWFLAEEGGVILHGAAVDSAEGAIAFSGPSGSGKTTAARNCPAPVLHQDRVAVGVAAGQAWLAPVPFLYAEPVDGPVGRRPLHRLLFVEKSARNALRDLPLRRRLERILGSVLVPPDPAVAQLVLEAVVRLAEHCPMNVLEARKHGGFWPLLVAGEPVAPSEKVA